MNIFAKIISYLFGLIMFLYVTTTILSFFGLGISSYGAYLFWIIAVVIFFLILPGKGNPKFLE